MSDLLDEVQEFTKQEFVNNFLRKYTKYIIGTSLFIILIAAIYAFYQNNHISKQEKFGEEYFKIIQSKNPNKDLEKLIQTDAGGFSEVAALNYAQNIEKKDPNKSMGVYTKLISTSDFKTITNYAIYRLGILALLHDNQEYLKVFHKNANVKNDSPFASLIKLTSVLVNIRSNQDSEKNLDYLEQISKNTSNPAELRFIADSLKNNIKK
jgi:hypothetical protein